MLLQPIPSRFDDILVKFNVQSLIDGWQAEVDVVAVALQAQGFDD